MRTWAKIGGSSATAWSHPLHSLLIDVDLSSCRPSEARPTSTCTWRTTITTRSPMVTRHASLNSAARCTATFSRHHLAAPSSTSLRFRATKASWTSSATSATCANAVHSCSRPPRRGRFHDTNACSGTPLQHVQCMFWPPRHGRSHVPEHALDRTRGSRAAPRHLLPHARPRHNAKVGDNTACTAPLALPAHEARPAPL